MDAVLEVAAGIYACGRALAPLAGNVVCLDMTPAMLSVGKAEAEKANFSNMTFVRGDAMELPFWDNSFDIVLSRLAFHLFSHSEQRLPRTEVEWKACADRFGSGRRIASEHGGRNRAPARSFAYAKSQPSGNAGILSDA